jgi:hypothetical protein
MQQLMLLTVAAAVAAATTTTTSGKHSRFDARMEDCDVSTRKTCKIVHVQEIEPPTPGKIILKVNLLKN